MSGSASLFFSPHFCQFRQFITWFVHFWLCWMLNCCCFSVCTLSVLCIKCSRQRRSVSRWAMPQHCDKTTKLMKLTVHHSQPLLANAFGKYFEYSCKSMLIFFVTFYDWSLLNAHMVAHWSNPPWLIAYSQSFVKHDNNEKDCWGLIGFVASRTARACVHGWPVEVQTDCDRRNSSTWWVNTLRCIRIHKAFTVWIDWTVISCSTMWFMFRRSARLITDAIFLVTS